MNTLNVSSKRLNSIDFMRGLVIVIMALDHIRDFLHAPALVQDPTDLATTTPTLFFTRFITHFCAPIFVFLAGTSAYLMLQKHNDLAKTRRLLFTRGLWLIFLELTIVCFGIFWDLKFRTYLLQVIFAIGAGFVMLSALIKLPAKTLGIIGLIIILFHNALPIIEFTNQGFKFTWSLFFERGFFNIAPGRGIVIGYPAVPWFGIMLLGFGFGKAFELTPEKRQKLFLISGITALIIFVALRTFNIYGDPSPWSPKNSAMFSFLSFINVTKYPPSLLYTAITLSVMFFVLCLAEGKNNKFMQFFITYGGVPMFFYLLHWYIVHISMFVMLLLQGVTFSQMPFGLMQFGRPETGVGLELPFVYLYWICLVLCMYPLCKWYGKYKAHHKQKWWLAYL